MATLPALKLTYFDVPGRAEAIRETLRLGGVTFVDERITSAEFAKMKPSLPYGKVPVLQVDDEVVAESQPILRYVGRLTGAYPPVSDQVACLLVDEMLDTFDDLFDRTLLPSFTEKNPEMKKQMREALMAGPLPHALEMIDKRLVETAAYPFFQGSPRVFVHELVVADVVEYLREGSVDHIPTSLIENYKAMVATHDKVKAQPKPTEQSPPWHEKPRETKMPSKLKLTYFDLPGRAKKIRLAFHIGGVPFEDERISFEEARVRKAMFPNDQLPVLEIDGLVAAQSSALLRYAGRIGGLYPSNNSLDAVRIDEVISHIGELYFALGPSLYEQDPEKKRAMREHFVTTTLPQSLGSLDKRIGQWKRNVDASPFVLGGAEPTVADLAVYTLVQFVASGFLDNVPTMLMATHANVNGVNAAVANHPRVVDWHAQQQQKPDEEDEVPVLST